MQFERKLEINCSLKRIFEILIDGPNEANWNSSIKSSIALSSKITQLSTTLGMMKKIMVKTKKNKIIAFKITGDPFKSMRYNLNPKYTEMLYNRANINSGQYIGSFPVFLLKKLLVRVKHKSINEVSIWFEYDKPENKEAIEETGALILNDLKKYAEYLEQGNDPENYAKEELLAIPQY